MQPAGDGPGTPPEEHTICQKNLHATNIWNLLPTSSEAEDPCQKPRLGRWRRVEPWSQRRRSTPHTDMGELVRSCPQRRTFRSRHTDTITSCHLDQKQISRRVLTMLTTRMCASSKQVQKRPPGPRNAGRTLGLTCCPPEAGLGDTEKDTRHIPKT